MLFVVPGEETLAEAARVQQRAEALGKFRTVLQRLELTLRERIIVRDVGPAETPSDAEIGEQQRHWFGSHRRACAIHRFDGRPGIGFQKLT